MAVAATVPTGSSLWSKAFWKGAAERAVKTFAQSLIGSSGVLGTTNVLTNGQAEDVLSMSVWKVALLLALVHAVLSVFTSIANPEFVAGKPNEPVVPVAPAPEAGVIPDGDGKYRAGSPTSVADDGPVIHEN